MEVFATGVERTRRHAGLLAADLLVVALVMLAGMVRHHPDLFAVAGRVVLVVGPFAVGWLVAAPLAGAYRDTGRRSVAEAAANGAGAWTLAALVGAGLRALPFLPGDSPPSFVAVVVGTGALAVAAWRAAFTAWLARGGE